MDKNKCPKIDFSEMMLKKRKMLNLYNKLPKLLKELYLQNYLVYDIFFLEIVYNGLYK
jgi:hypothetical protein